MIGADRRTRGFLAAAILLGGFVGPLLLLFGLRMALAGSVSLILNLEMAATACLGILLFREHLPRRGLLAVAGIVGAGILISLASGWPGVAAGFLVGLACVCWGLDNHFTALIDGITPAQSTLWKGAAAGTANLAIGLYLAPLAASWTHVSAALAVGALAYGISITLYISSAQQLGATRAQGVFATAPFIGAGVAFVALGEPFGVWHVAGLVVLVPSVLALVASQHTHIHEHPVVEHIHSHRHDDGHHLHQHPGLQPSTRHTHWHRHEPLVHEHPHWPDIHHRHAH